MRRVFASRHPDWSLRTAASAAEAVQLLEEEAADVVVTDLALGGVDGVELLGVVLERWPGTLRIVFTGHGTGPEVVRAAAVAHQVVPKGTETCALFGAIEGALERSDLIVDRAMRGWVLACHELPSGPSLWPQLERALQEPKTTAADLAALIERDPAVTARVLQLASSAYFNVSRRPSSVTQATQWIGVNNLRGLVLSVELARLFSRVPTTLDVERLAMNGFRVGSLAMAMLPDGPDAQRALMGGILHDLGLLVRGMRCPEALLADMDTSAQTGTPLQHVERTMRGFTHAEAGAALLGLWGIDERVVSIVRDHHQLPRGSTEHLTDAGAVYLADLLIAEADEGSPNPRLDVDASWLGVEDQMPRWRRLAAPPAEEVRQERAQLQAAAR